MAKTVFLCFAPLFLGLILISGVLMSFNGVNGFEICFDTNLEDPWGITPGACQAQCERNENNVAPYRFLTSQLHNIWSFSPTKCNCCYSDGNL
ncbi:hypothetical protein MKW98_031079 [Papaver atlanticum]|uniref:Uncharacterized protein n=1 Tax=Papaver atlanticum TaxID=357466 RepID=A0AAD4SX80_9MAGN|nr:hypothetical protein MKW98_031079 [Papaver atlanticum]